MTSPPAHPLRLDIDLNALAENWRWFDARAGAAVTGAAVKADGYGLGADQVVTALMGAGCRDFFVTTMAEAETLLPMADAVSLYALHGPDPDSAPLPGVIPVLNTEAQVAQWKEAGAGAPCHVMVDTGMNRLGLDWRGFDAAMLDGLNVTMVHSHLACADDPGAAMNGQQHERFSYIAAAVRGRFPGAKSALAGSGGACLGSDYAFDMIRPGLGLYGGVPHPAAAGELKQVVRPHARLVQIRSVPAEDSVGYGATWHAEAVTRVGTLNVGYADGYLRGFSNAGAVRADGQILPVIGRVSMDLITVDLGTSGAAVGDWLEIDCDLPDAAAQSGLSQYELLTGLGHRYQRRYT